MKLCQILAKSSNPRRSYCNFSVWPYDLEHVLRVELCCGIIFTKSKLSQCICSWDVTIFLLRIRYVTLWHWPLTPWPWTLHHFGCHVFRFCTKFERNRIIHGWVIDDCENQLPCQIQDGGRFQIFSLQIAITQPGGLFNVAQITDRIWSHDTQWHAFIDFCNVECRAYCNRRTINLMMMMMMMNVIQTFKVKGPKSKVTGGGLA